MAKTVVGFFNTAQDARDAIQDLHAAGMSREAISFIANNPGDAYDADIQGSGTEAEEGAVVGATGGAVLGGLGGLLVGLGTLTIPGIGPIVGGGVLLSILAGAGIGAAAGGLVGALVGAGIPEEEANVYAEGVRRDGALVTVQVQTMEDADRVATILHDHNAVDIDQRGREYREGGGPHLDENAEPHDRTSATGTVNDDVYARSSKVGTATGGVAGAATGAALGSAGGPVGTVVGGVAGALAGGSIGAASDAAGVAASDRDDTVQPSETAPSTEYDTAPTATVSGTASPSYAASSETGAINDVDRDNDVAGRSER